MQQHKPWRVPAFLLALGALNVALGGVQLHNLALGPSADGLASDITPAYYHDTALPIALHLVFGIIFSLIAPLQFAPNIRSRYPNWHRYAGRFLCIAGLISVNSGLWMNHYFPAFGSGIKYWSVLLFGITMNFCLCLGVWFAVHKKFAAHQLCMTLAIAIGLTPSLQKIILIPAFVIFGDLTALTTEIVVLLSYLFSSAVAILFSLPQHNNDKTQTHHFLEAAHERMGKT